MDSVIEMAQWMVQSLEVEELGSVYVPMRRSVMVLELVQSNLLILMVPVVQ